jgi:hypothetical protein
LIELSSNVRLLPGTAVRHDEDTVAPCEQTWTASVDRVAPSASIFPAA